MKEQLYTIPVNDAFNKDCECPLCQMYKEIEDEAIEFTLGPSYMEDDIRMETDKTGFCANHIKRLYDCQNRLGVALMLHTHMKHTIKSLEKLSKSDNISKKSIFKKNEQSPVTNYINNLDNSCYICNRINNMFERYIVTVLHCYQTDDAFRDKFKNSKGFCTKHYGMLYDEAQKSLSGAKLNDFIKTLNEIYFENIKRVTDDLEWFIDKFDYRNEDAPWKNSKDAVQRSIIKTNSTFVE